MNGDTSLSDDFAEGATITFPSNPSDIQGKVFRGWVTAPIDGTTDEEPSYVNTTTTTMGNSDITYYAVFATATVSGDPVETKTQTLQYDTWTYGGSTTDKNSYRLFHTDGYVESSAFDLSKLSKVKVYGGTFGGGTYNSLTIGDGTNIWKSVTVSGTSNTGEHSYTEGSALSGTKALRVTSTCGSSSGSGTGVRISKVEIYTMVTPYTYSDYCTDIELFTIIAMSNNDNYGTVSLSGEVISGSPKSGYRYASPAYSVSPANSATVVQNGNEFTVTPTANTIITINFELIPTFTLSGAVLPNANAGTVTLSASSGLVEGATPTATASASAGYKFKNWSISGTGASLSSTTDNPTTVTIGTADATVTANFEAVKTYAITYSVNGKTNTVNVEENTDVDLSAPSSALIPIGYVFKGWSTSVIATPTDTDPANYITSATSTADNTYYAVMAVGTSTSTTVTLNAPSSTSGYNTGTKNDDKGNTWSYYAAINNESGTMAFGLNSHTDNHNIGSPLFDGDITAISMKVKNGSSTTTRTVYICSSNATAQPTSGDIATLSVPESSTYNTERSINLSSSPTFSQFYVYVSAALGFSEIKVTYNKTAYSNFCTSVSAVTMTGDLTITGDLNINNYTLTVPSGNTLTVTGDLTNGTAANLIIEDGGQLIISSSHTDDNAVKATMQKSITASIADNPATEADETDNKWYAISSPVNSVEISRFAPAAPAKYNVYYYDEPTMMWMNDKLLSDPEDPTSVYAAYENLANGRGYLYRSTAGSIEFKGDVNVSNVTFNSVDTDYKLTYTKGAGILKGFHLLGNPFSQNISWTNIIINSSIADAGYYTLKTDGTWNTQTTGGTIAPMQGFLIQVVEPEENITPTPVVTISKPTGSGKGELYANDQIMFHVENSQYSDNSYVLFKKGHGLNKIEHRNSEIPMIYIIDNGENFAIADMPDNTSVINIGFDAKTMGQYTFSLKAEGRYSYMHLIDKLTGEDMDMLIEDSYTFMGSPRDRKDRFVLRLNYNAAGIDTESDIFAYQSGSDILVSGEGELQIFDIMGRMVMNQRINGVQTIDGINNGVYIFKLEGKTQKIVIR